MVETSIGKLISSFTFLFAVILIGVALRYFEVPMNGLPKLLESIIEFNKKP